MSGPTVSPLSLAVQLLTLLQSLVHGGSFTDMRNWDFLVLLGLALQPAMLSALTEDPVSTPTEQQLRGLDESEAAALISKLKDAQGKLRAGEFQSFQLISGSIAAYEMTKVSPRDAFLQVSFEEVWEIERVTTDNRLWQPFKLAYAPNGLGQLYWDIEVVLGANGQIERVMMIYKPPAPF